MKVKKDQVNIDQNKPTREEAMEAVKTLISWACLLYTSDAADE